MLDEDFDAVLGVTPQADAEAIKKAFRRRSFACHPDHHRGDPAATARFQALNDAYAVLGNDDARALYYRLKADTEHHGSFRDACARFKHGVPRSQASAADKQKTSAQDTRIVKERVWRMFDDLLDEFDENGIHRPVKLRDQDPNSAAARRIMLNIVQGFMGIDNPDEAESFFLQAAIAFRVGTEVIRVHFPEQLHKKCLGIKKRRLAFKKLGKERAIRSLLEEAKRTGFFANADAQTSGTTGHRASLRGRSTAFRCDL